MKFLGFCVVISLILNIHGKERLPQPLPEKDYNMLLEALRSNSFKMTKSYNTQTKRVYRLFTSGRYKLESVCHPITGNQERLIVSKFLKIFSSLNNQKII